MAVHVRARALGWGCTAWFIGLCGCSSVEHGGERGGALALERSAEIPAATTGNKPQRGRVLGGERAARVIAWPAAERIDHVARARYDAGLQARIDDAPIPVLAPPEAGARAVLTSGPSWYALTVHGDGYLLHTHGSGEARVHPHVRTFEPTHPMRDGAGFVTRNEEIWSASWIEHGVAYSFEIECDRRAVTWCDDERAFMTRLESLVYVGGRGGAR
jgi:hypothetical protein